MILPTFNGSYEFLATPLYYDDYLKCLHWLILMKLLFKEPKLLYEGNSTLFLNGTQPSIIIGTQLCL
jgi:hypothetical protein